MTGVYAIFLCVCFFSDCLYKSICCGYSFKLHRQIDAIQMGTNNICLYKEVDKKYTGCNLKTMELLECVVIRVCAIIRSNTVHHNSRKGAFFNHEPMLWVFIRRALSRCF